VSEAVKPGTEIVTVEFESAPLMAFGAAGIGLAPVEQQAIILAEFDARRDFFRKWLLAHLVEGLHYGFVPGCEVEYDEHGNMVQWVFNRRTSQRERKVVSKKQWRAKPSLYKVGAQLLIDLLGLRDQYESDLDAWKMLGEPKGTFVRSCKLFRGDGRMIGEGTGAFRVGEKHMEENSSIKMADKRAMVAAVLNSIPVVADLFTQDMEDSDRGKAKPKDDRPKANVNGPTETAIFCFRERVARKRKGMDAPDDAAFVALVCEAAFEKPSLETLTKEQFVELGKALAAGKYDWATGEPTAKPAIDPDDPKTWPKDPETGDPIPPAFQ